MIALWVPMLLMAAPSAVLPDDLTPYAPGQVRATEGGAIPSANVTDGKNCGTCHTDIAAQWKTSTHAFASFTNPLYRVAIDTLRSERGTTESRMCGSCHDLALLTKGALDRPDIDPQDPAAHAGVSCTTCHSATHASRDGNGSLTLRADSPFPSDPALATLEAHRARVASPQLRTAELCGSCHRSFLFEQTGNTAAFFGMDDFGAWQRTAYAGSHAERPDHVQQNDCRTCHMPREAATLGDVAAKQGTVPSHRFLGAHTTLAAMRGDAAQVARLQAFLARAVTVDVAAAKVDDGPWQLPASSAMPRAGQTLELDVVIFNERTGHRFPGGVLDNQGTTLEVTVRDARGATVAVSSQHELRSQVVDAEGQPLELRQTHRFVTAVWNHTVPARDARVIRVRATLPPALELPLVVEARVLHRARAAQLMQTVCDEARTPRGRAFLASAARHTGAQLDPCVNQPVTVIDATRVTLCGIADHDDFERSYRYGLGLSVALQEYLDEAQSALVHARTLATGEQLGRVEWALGQLAAKRGQLPAALAHLALAERVLGPTAAVLKTRGDAYGQVWRFKEAATAWRAAATLAPGDLSLWASLSMAEASLGHWSASLQAAQAGLALHPRDGDCLRVQALALERLGLDSAQALDAALRWRAPDDGPRAKAACSATVAGCAERRNPVPTFDAVPPSSAAP